MYCYFLLQPIRCVDILHFRHQKGGKGAGKREGWGWGVLITGDSVSLRKNVLTPKIPEKE